VSGKRDIMTFKPPKGWDRESDILFIHESGVRIQRRVYKEKEGWFLIPADLDREVLAYDPTPEGRDRAFADFAEGKLNPPKKRKAPAPEKPAPARRGRKPRPVPEEGEGEEGEERPEGEPKDEKEEKDKEDKEDADDDEDDEDDEKE
jgi:hypothetical protein